MVHGIEQEPIVVENTEGVAENGAVGQKDRCCDDDRRDRDRGEVETDWVALNILKQCVGMFQRRDSFCRMGLLNEPKPALRPVLVDSIAHLNSAFNPCACKLSFCKSAGSVPRRPGQRPTRAPHIPKVHVLPSQTAAQIASYCLMYTASLA